MKSHFSFVTKLEMREISQSLRERGRGEAYLLPACTWTAVYDVIITCCRKIDTSVNNTFPRTTGWCLQGSCLAGVAQLPHNGTSHSPPPPSQYSCPDLPRRAFLAPQCSRGSAMDWSIMLVICVGTRILGELGRRSWLNVGWDLPRRKVFDVILFWEQCSSLSRSVLSVNWCPAWWVTSATDNISCYLALRAILTTASLYAEH